MNPNFFVLDIETKNTFFDVGGEKNIKHLDLSLACVYSYASDKFLSFWENEISDLGDLLKKSSLIVGFGINRFDLPVLEKYFKFNLKSLRRIDLLDEIEITLGRRWSLDSLARANLGVGKTHHSGLEAIRLWNEKKLGELEEYCLNDVKITRDIFELAKLRGYLYLPENFSTHLSKIELDFTNVITEASNEKTLF